MKYLHVYFKWYNIHCGKFAFILFCKVFSIFFSLQGLVNDKDSKDSMTEGENLEEDEEEEEGGAETEEQSGNESEVNEPEEEVMTFIYSR